MGKTVTNERIKYTATFFNNAAGGIFVGGLFILVFSVFAHDKLFTTPIDVLWRGEVRFESPDIHGLIGKLLTLMVTLVFSFAFRCHADNLLRKI